MRAQIIKYLLIKFVCYPENFGKGRERQMHPKQFINHSLTEFCRPAVPCGGGGNLYCSWVLGTVGWSLAFTSAWRLLSLVSLCVMRERVFIPYLACGFD